MMSSVNILIAEKEMVVSLDLKLFLKRNNFRISSVVSSSEDLISDYELKKPDLMIIDFDLKGISSLKKLRSEEHPPIIFLSGFHQQKLEKFCDKFSPCSVLKKPIKQTELLQSIIKFFPQK